MTLTVELWRPTNYVGVLSITIKLHLQYNYERHSKLKIGNAHYTVFPNLASFLRHLRHIVRDTSNV